MRLLLFSFNFFFFQNIFHCGIPLGRGFITIFKKLQWSKKKIVQWIKTCTLDTMKSVFKRHDCLRLHICFNMTLYYKMRHLPLWNVTAIALQNATKLYYKMRWFYYKMQQLLQNATFSSQTVLAVTKCDVYYYKCRYSFWK